MTKFGPITKYFQITAVVGVFVGLAFLRQILGYNNVQANINNQVVNSATPNSLVVPMSTPFTINNRRGEDNEDDEDFRRVARVTPVVTALPVSSATPATVAVIPPTASAQSGQYRDGTYTGQIADAYYGNVQVQLVVGGGKITKVNVLQFPNDNGTSRSINNQAMPILQQEVIQVQSGNINAVSGASASSQAFSQSLNSAIQQAKVV
jgi:uncharacterized protein with FMN-binding domain